MTILDPARSLGDGASILSSPARGLWRLAWLRGKPQPGLVLAWTVVALAGLWTLAPGLFTSWNPLTGVAGAQLQAPGAAHWLGTDALGRDLYARLVFGAVHSLSGALAAVAVGLAVGSAVGLLAGSCGGWVDEAVMRLVDVLLSVPTLLLSLSIIILLGFGTLNASLAVGATAIAGFARLMRAEVVRVRRADYVEAAFGSGGSFLQVLWRHILPNSLTSVLAFSALQFGWAILQISTLGFLGYGGAAADARMGAADRRGTQLHRHFLVADRRARAGGGGRGALGQSYRPRDRAVRAMSGGAERVLEVSGLCVSYGAGAEQSRVVHDVSFQVAPGEVVALVGESGSGKTTTAQAIIGLLPGSGRIEAGSVRLGGTEIAGWSQKRLDGIRGAVVSLVPQDPTSSLDPVMTIGAQVAEILEVHGRVPARLARKRVVELLAQVGLSQPELRARQYPHELSGGMKQRVLIAIAIALEPALIIADEPTSALDVTVQRRILDLIDELRRAHGTAVLLVTHDLGIAADRADRVIVLQNGRIQEQGGMHEVLAAPGSPYTRKLLADAPAFKTAPPRPSLPAAAETVVRVEGLVQDFALPGRSRLRAVDGVSFSVARGTTHAIVGESGSGKTTTIRAVAGFLRPTAGRIEIAGRERHALRGEALRQFRRSVQLVYQNPFGSLDPRQTIRAVVEEPLRNFAPLDRTDRTARVEALIERVGLPRSVLGRRPHALSGGQRQRVAIARALILEPEVVVLDEAVSALDATVQGQILDLLDELQKDLGLTYLFVSHDLAVVRQIADTVSVLHNGRQVDHGRVAEVFARPASDYTRELIAAIPGQGLGRPSALDRDQSEQFR